MHTSSIIKALERDKKEWMLGASNMTWLVMLVGFALVLAPIMWIMPNKGQRRQEAMRTRARELGLQVRVGTLPQTRIQGVRKDETRRGICYLLPIRRKSSDIVPAWTVWPEADENGEIVGAGEDSFSLGELKTAIQSEIAAVPLTVRAVDHHQLGIGVWWNEQGEVSEVDVLKEFLEKLAQLISASK